MSYNEIIQSIEQGKKVFWKNTGYKVILDNRTLYTIFISNESMCRLQASEIKDCFIGV